MSEWEDAVRERRIRDLIREEIQKIREEDIKDIERALEKDESEGEKTAY